MNRSPGRVTFVQMSSTSPAGLVDAFRREVVERGSTIGEVVVPYLVDPEPYVDLDTEHDFVIAEVVLGLLRKAQAGAR